jgi:hypothetical protein
VPVLKKNKLPTLKNRIRAAMILKKKRAIKVKKLLKSHRKRNLENRER